MDDGRGRTLAALDGDAGLDSLDLDTDKLGWRVRVVHRLSKREDRDVDESPLALLTPEEELDELEHVRARRARGREMTRSPEWNKLEYSTPVTQSFAINQDMVVRTRSGADEPQ